MRRKHMIMLFTGALGAAVAVGGTAAAGSNYPPSADTPVAVVAASADSPSPTAVTTDPTGLTTDPTGVSSGATAVTTTSGGELPQTGGDNQVIVELAAGGVLAGVGMVVVARRRRRS